MAMGLEVQKARFLHNYYTVLVKQKNDRREPSQTQTTSYQSSRLCYTSRFNMDRIKAFLNAAQRTPLLAS